MDSAVAEALKKAKSEETDAEEEEDNLDEEEPSLADILSSITEILAELTERKKKGPLIETHIRDLV